jgi:hypothetical protein
MEGGDCSMIEIELEQLWQSIRWPLLDRLPAARLSPECVSFEAAQPSLVHLQKKRRGKE